MSAVFEHWSYDPFIIVVVVIIAIHGWGLRKHLAAVSRARRDTRPWLGQALLFWAGLVVLLLAVVSPVDYWSDTYLTAHIIQHILLAFIAPPLIVLGAPWVPVLLGLPRIVRKGYGRLLQYTMPGRTVPASPGWRAARRVRKFAAKPWVSVIAFNFVMVFWHLPGPFQLAASNQYVHIWLSHGSFFAFGVCLFLQVFGSYPFRPVLPAPARVLALVVTNAVMVAVAMTLVMFTHNVYEWYAGAGASRQAADQQIAGAILWVCGEITFLPSILYTVAKWLDDDPRWSDKKAKNPATIT